MRLFNTKQLTVMITQGLTLQLMVFGENDLRGHTLMLEFLTLVHPQINHWSPNEAFLTSITSTVQTSNNTL